MVVVPARQAKRKQPGGIGSLESILTSLKVRALRSKDMN
jgi:hypothetical protein